MRESAMQGAAQGQPRAAEPVLPLALLIRGRIGLVVGAGHAAHRKVLSLVEAGASVIVVAPEACDGLAELSARGAVRWRRRAFEDGDVDGIFVAFAATDDPDVNRRVLDACRRASSRC